MSHSSIAALPIVPVYLLSELPHQFAKEYCNETPIGALNYIWLTPLNIATNLLAMAITPVLALVDLVAAGIFAAIGACCSNGYDKEEWYDSAKECAYIAFAFSTVGELMMLSRLFNVNACQHAFD